MLDTRCPRRRKPVFLLIAIGALCFAMSCAPSPTKKKVSGLAPETPAQIDSISVVSLPSDAEARIAITNSRTTPYTAFKLGQPLRLIVDVTAQPAEELTVPDVTGDKIIKALTFESIKDEPLVTRVTATLFQDVEYSVQERDGTIDVLLSPKKPAETVEPPVMAAKEEEIPPGKPRLFFAPGKTKANQILGIDFFMLPKGKSRVTVTTRERAPYELSRKDSLNLLLEVKNVTIRPELTRYIDSSYFKGVVNRITPMVRVADKGVDLEIKLREVVPYHVVQTDQEIRIDFSKTSVGPPAKTITAARLAEKQVVKEEIPEQERPAVTPAVSQPRPLERETYRKYTGERITLDFANADIRNILKLIGEVSKLNLVWGPEVKGTVSMRLKNVPWDQALDIVLESNDLGMIREGNIIWVTTKGKIKNLEKDRQDKLKTEQERIKVTKDAEKEAEEAEPLITDYITVNYADVTDIRKLIEENVKGPRGKISVDTANKTIIYTDIASKVEKARALKTRQDKPSKQVMIEARIVEAKTTFSRDLGINWRGLSYSTKRNPWGGGGPNSSRSYDYSFATNFTAAADTAIGLNFANASGTMSSIINAQIALAETEGTLKTLSAPKIITRDTVQATIKQGTTIYIPYTDVEGNRTAKEVDATLELSVTPNITPNDMVIMKISVSDDYPDYANRVGEFVPVLRKNAMTEMMIASGDTVVIGGIYKESKGITDTGTPWLRKIPVIGWLFGVENKSTEKSELLIFLTPRVMPVTPMG
ncbi:MAG TPA: type IV pilus secretin PilQ [Desulfatiglandales bacterium]|nr:type IV pilus secretin PilQ [Desulfatiglandales bacterium]